MNDIYSLAVYEKNIHAPKLESIKYFSSIEKAKAYAQKLSSDWIEWYELGVSGCRSDNLPYMLFVIGKVYVIE